MPDQDFLRLSKQAEAKQTAGAMKGMDADFMRLATKAPAPQRPAPKEQGSFLDPLLQGATFGWSDELAAVGGYLGARLAGAPPERAERAGQREMSAARNRLAAYREERPIVSMAGEIAGTLPAAIATGGLAGTVPRAVALGAGEGAIAGAGAADQNRLAGAALGAGAGATLAGVMPMAGDLIRRAWKAGKSWAKPLVRRMTEEPQTAAQRVLVDALQAGGVTEKDLLQAAKELGPEATMVDVAGSTGIGVGQGTISADPTGRAVIMARKMAEERAKGASKRLATGVQKATGIKQRLQESLDALKSRQQEQAQDLYKIAYKYKPKPDDQRLVNILNRPALRDALPEALRDIQNRGGSAPVLEKIVMRGKEWVPQKEMFPDMRTLDEVKRILDKQVSAGMKSMNASDRTRAAGIKQARDALKSYLDEVNPRYKMARNQFAGDAALLDAMETGEKFLNMKTREVTSAVRDMGDSEKQAFLKGAVEAIREKMGKAREGEMGMFRFLETGNAKEKLRAMFPAGAQGNKQMAELISTLNRERTFATTQGQLIGGSQTELRRAAGEAIRGQAGIPTSAEALTSPVRSAVGAGLRQAQQALSGISQKSIDELADLMFTPGNIPVIVRELRRRGVPQETISQFLKRASKAGAAAAPAAGLGAGEIAE